MWFAYILTESIFPKLLLEERLHRVLGFNVFELPSSQFTPVAVLRDMLEIRIVSSLLPRTPLNRRSREYSFRIGLPPNGQLRSARGGGAARQRGRQRGRRATAARRALMHSAAVRRSFVHAGRHQVGPQRRLALRKPARPHGGSGTDRGRSERSSKSREPAPTSLPAQLPDEPPTLQ